MNTRFGRRLSETEIEYAPSAVMIEGRGMCLNPGAEEYLANVPPYKLIVSRPPDPSEGHIIVPVGWTETETQVVRTFEEREIEYTIDDYNQAMEEKIREERIARGYDTREPSLYINSSIPRWKADAQDWIAYIDAVMVYAQAEIAKWKTSGEKPTIAEFIAGMPKVEWSMKD